MVSDLGQLWEVIVVRDIQLVKLEPAIEEPLVGDPAYLKAMMAENWPGVAAVVHQVVGRTLSVQPVSVDELTWGGYFVVDTATREVVGSCAFKGQPYDDGIVEVAYFTYPGFQGKGYATSMLEKLIALARGCSQVKRVVAHTLPISNASTRVLEKNGMLFVGEVTDPDDGQVWRWQKLIAGE